MDPTDPDPQHCLWLQPLVYTGGAGGREAWEAGAGQLEAAAQGPRRPRQDTGQVHEAAVEGENHLEPQIARHSYERSLKQLFRRSFLVFDAGVPELLFLLSQLTTVATRRGPNCFNVLVSCVDTSYTNVPTIAVKSCYCYCYSEIVLRPHIPLVSSIAVKSSQLFLRDLFLFSVLIPHHY